MVAERIEFAVERLGQTFDGELDRRIDPELRCAPMAADRRDGENVAGPSVAHMWRHEPVS